MVKIFNANLIKDHFFTNDGNKNSKPMGELYLQNARNNVDPTFSEFRGLEYFAQRKVLFDYPNKRLELGKYE